MADSLIRLRYAAFGAVLVLFLGLLLLGRHVQYEQSIQSFFAPDDPAVRSLRAASELFGNDNVVFLAYDDPALLTPPGMARVAELAAAVGPGRIEAVVGVQSIDAMPLFWRIDDELIRLEGLPAFLRSGAIRVAKGLVRNMDPRGGSLSIAGAIRDAKSEAERKALAARITKHPLLVGTLVNGSGTCTAVVVQLKGMSEQDPKATIAALRAAADGFAARYNLKRPALVGPPVLLADGFTSIEVDGRRLALVGMLLIGLVTLSATHSLWWAAVPILAGWVVWLSTETILSFLNLKLSLSGGPIVAQIIVLTMPAASHLAIHFRDDLRKERDRRLAARSTLESVTSPIVWCALTGTIGYGALVTSNVVPVRQFGVVLALSTLAAAVLTLAISPVAMLPPVRLEVPVRHGSTSRVGGLLNGLTRWIYRHPAPIVVGVLALFLPVSVGATLLHYESNYINAFQPESRVVRDYHFVEARLGGIGLVYLVVPVGKTLDRNTLMKFRELDESLAGVGQDPESPARALTRWVSLGTVLDPDGRLVALGPVKGDRALATKLDLIGSTSQADLLKGFWNREKGWARVLVRVSERQEAGTKEASFDEARIRARAIFGEGTYLTGLSYLLTQTTRGVMATQWSTFFWAAGGIFLMLTLAFRGPGLAALALLPTLLAVALVLGLMGWFEIKLDIATALVASVALGLSVDDTFHCLLQFRRHLAASGNFRESLLASYAITGPGVILSSVAVAAGFAVLRFSEFVPFYNFGTMVGIATLGSSLGNLVLLPACLALGHRLSRRGEDSLSEPRA